VAEAYRIPPRLYLRCAAREAIRHPLACMFAFAVGFYIRARGEASRRELITDVGIASIV
jgi:hypothetical protein